MDSLSFPGFPGFLGFPGFICSFSEHYFFFQEEMFTDVTLAVDNETFEAHKLVLSACSPYFKHLLTSNKCRHPVIFLKDVESHHIALLLQYMYLGQIAVKREELSTFLRSADHLKIRGLAMTSPTSALPRYIFSLNNFRKFMGSFR